MADHEKEGKSGGHGLSMHASHEEHEGAPEWLISFADNVMLQMGFFVILLAINMGIKAKGPMDRPGDGITAGPPTEMLDMAIAIRAGFNRPVDLNSTRPEDQPLIRRIIEKRDGISRQPGDRGDAQEAQAIRPTEHSAQGGLIPFDDDTAELNARGRERAEDIARRLRGQRWIIEVRGHAAPSEAALNIERGIDLGHRRALAVAKIMAEHGVTWEQMRIVSCGDSNRRVHREYDRDADRANQRVEVIVTGDPAR
jgi:outer membrane protein OmpA-like peptidoglycan-associated protein